MPPALPTWCPGATAPPLAPPAAAAPPLANCEVFPADNYWHADVSELPVLGRSDDYVDSIGRDVGLKADFGSGLWDGGPIGIPYMLTDPTTRRMPVTFTWPDESDR